MARDALKPLEGILVVSMEQAVAAPYCASRLADAGARVIKVERAEGDFARAYDSVVHGESAYFVWLNRGKESLTANIKEEADREHAEADAHQCLLEVMPARIARHDGLIVAELCAQLKSARAQLLKLCGLSLCLQPLSNEVFGRRAFHPDADLQLFCLCLNASQLQSLLVRAQLLLFDERLVSSRP